MPADPSGRRSWQRRCFISVLRLRLGNVIKESLKKPVIPAERGCCRFSGSTTTACPLRAQAGIQGFKSRGESSADWLPEESRNSAARYRNSGAAIPRISGPEETNMSKQLKMQQGSDNVFLDLGFPRMKHKIYCFARNSCPRCAPSQEA